MKFGQNVCLDQCYDTQMSVTGPSWPSCFSPFSIAITLLWEERELILVLFVRLFDLHLFGFVCFLFPFSCLGWAAVCDCGTPWTFLLPLFFKLLWSTIG